MKIVNSNQIEDNPDLNVFRNLKNLFREDKKSEFKKAIIVFFFTVAVFLIFYDSIKSEIILFDESNGVYRIDTEGSVSFGLKCLFALYFSSFIVQSVFWFRSQIFDPREILHFSLRFIVVSFTIFLISFLLSGMALNQKGNYEDLLDKVFWNEFPLRLSLFVGYYFTFYIYSLYLYTRLEALHSVTENRFLRYSIAAIIYSISSIPVFFVLHIIYYAIINVFVLSYSFSNNLENKPAEYFDTPYKRKMWWYSQDSEWEEVFRTAHFEDYLYTDSWPLSEIKYYLGIPYFPDDEYISHFFKIRSLDGQRYYTWSGLIPDNQMEKYLTNLSGILSLTNIEYLYLGNTRIDNYENLHRLNKLKTLWLFNTDLKNLDLLSFVSDNLNEIDLQYNHLVNLKGINKLKNLLKLKCNNNKIESLEELSELSKLEFLDCNSNNIKSVNGLQELTNLKTLIIYDNPVVDSVGLKNLKVKNLITTQEEFFEWQGNGHGLCEHLFEMQTGFYKKYRYLTYNLDSLTTILPMGDTRKLVLEFNDSTIVIKMDKGYNKFAYSLMMENDSIIFDYDLIEKIKIGNAE